MKINLGCIIFITGLVFVVGCQGPGGKVEIIKEKQVLVTARNFSRITGTQWTLLRMTVDGVEYPLGEEVPFIKFAANGRVSGSASVNRFFGTMQIGKQGGVQWSQAFGSTRMAGPDELMAQEDVFLKVLPLTEQISVGKTYLYVYSLDRLVELIFYVPEDLTFDSL